MKTKNEMIFKRVSLRHSRNAYKVYAYCPKKEAHLLCGFIRLCEDKYFYYAHERDYIIIHGVWLLDVAELKQIVAFLEVLNEE